MQDQSNNKPVLSWADWLLAVLFAVIILIMIAQVIFRYALNHSLFWSEEIVRYLFIWLVFLGGAMVLRDREHIGVEFFLSKLPDRISQVLEKINTGLIVAVNLLFVIAGFFWVYEIRGSYSPALGLPLNWLLYGALPVSSLLSLVFGIEWLFRKMAKRSEEKGGVL